MAGIPKRATGSRIGQSVPETEATPNVTEETVNTVAAAHIARVSVRQLNHWAACGYVRPIGNRGIGNPDRWTVGEIDVAEMLGAFSRVFNQRDFFGVLAEGLRHGTTVELGDGDYAFVLEIRANAN